MTPDKIVSEDIDFGKIVEHLDDLESTYGPRNTLLNSIESAVLMEWEDKDKPTGEKVKITVSPAARIPYLGAKRLLTAGIPSFSIPYDKNNKEKQSTYDKLENFANAVWMMSGIARQRPVEYDVINSAVLFGNIDIAVIPTQQLLKNVEGGSKATVNRMKHIADTSPFIYDIFDCRTCFPERSNFGLSCWGRKVECLAGEILDLYGSAAEEISGLKQTARFESHVLCEFWDTVLHLVWIQGSKQPIISEEHGYPVIPIVSQLTDGSTIHSKEYETQPLLYGIIKSGFWARENLAYTALFTNLFAVGSNATFIEKLNSDRVVTIDTGIPGGAIKMFVGESIEPLIKNAIDESIMKGLAVTTKVNEEQTMFRTAIGEALGANTPFSTQSLVEQAGRNPLIETQRMSQWALAKAMEITFSLIKDGKAGKKVQNLAGSVIDVTDVDIPDNLIMGCKIDVDVPQDERMNVLVAGTAVEKGLASNRYARENYMNIGQSEDMDREIYREKAIALMAAGQFELVKLQISQMIENAKLQFQNKNKPIGTGTSVAEVPPTAPVEANPATMPPPEAVGINPNTPGAGFNMPNMEGMTPEQQQAIITQLTALQEMGAPNAQPGVGGTPNRAVLAVPQAGVGTPEEMGNLGQLERAAAGKPASPVRIKKKGNIR